MAPLVLLAAGLQLAYFLDLKADTITSCCGKMFAPEKQGAGRRNGRAWRADGADRCFSAALAELMAVGAAPHPLAGARIAVYGAASGAFFVIAIAAVVSVISLYVYEHPHHHCPFCLLKREYGYFGFALYAPLFAGTALGLSAGFLGLMRRTASLDAILPALLRRFVAVSLGCFAIFVILVAWAVAASKLILFG